MSNPVDQFLDTLLALVASRRADGLLLETGLPPTVMCEEGLKAVSPQPLVAMHLDRLCEALLDRHVSDVEFEILQPQAGRFRVCLSRVDDRRRVVVQQLLPPQGVAELGLPDRLGDLVLQPRGLVLLSAPLGHEMRAELAALIGHRIAHREERVLLVGDPGNRTFADQPGAVNCCDPRHEWVWRDRLVSTHPVPVGMAAFADVRSRAEMDAALAFAERGLALVMLDGRCVTDGIERGIGLYPGEQRAQVLGLMADQLRAAAAFRAVPREAPAWCSTPVTATELLLRDAPVMDLLRQGHLGELRPVMQQTPPMQTFEQSLADLWHRALISTDDAVAQADDPQELRQRIRICRSNPGILDISTPGIDIQWRLPADAG